MPLDNGNGNTKWDGTTWDYKMVEGHGQVNSQGLLQSLAKLGLDGWELCGTLMLEGGVPGLILKRQHVVDINETLVGSDFFRRY